ncbi:Enoyl-(acyl-carrier-protein) reductase (NADH) [Citrus sinensis]|uniref:Enoyl-(Acyl-carrier-protein) reductase (NADH) n=1 Tax=Citrus sinensis TaxID=2711 RepID=A0ACB8K0N2_CITSI|nr:Enoyl-(acyl-carrier-protein) reductase (NADH) [Citrus sinensis]
MSAAAPFGTQVATIKPCISSSIKNFKSIKATFATMYENQLLEGLQLASQQRSNKRAFIAAIADDNGYGWAVAKSLAATGVEVLIGLLMEIFKVYPLDAVYDNPEDVPKNVKNNKRHAGPQKWTEIAESVKQHFGSIDILVHSLVNGPKETSRHGYLGSASTTSFVSLLKHFVPIMNPGGASISLTYMGSESFIPGCGGGMSLARSALESDTRVLALEAGRKHKIRVNTISTAMPKAIGFIDVMIDYSLENASLQKEMSAAFLASSLASAITGAVIYVHNGLDAMGDGAESLTF